MDKAFDRIKADFNDTIQKGYDQCLRVKKKFNSSDKFPIYNSKGTLIHEVNPKHIHRVFSIVVTSDRLGPIQQNLGLLLNIDDDEEYPWSVYVNDLEILLRTLQILYKNPRYKFCEFLRFRELMHDRQVCYDEMDICAFYVSNPKEFIRLANELDSTLSFSPDNQDFFDDIYYQGIGLLEDELFIDLKKSRGFIPSNTKVRAFPIKL